MAMKLIRGDRVVHVDEPARIGRVEGVFGAYIVVVRWPHNSVTNTCTTCAK